MRGETKLGEDLRPSAQLKKLYYTYLFAGLFIFFLIFCLPAILFAPIGVLLVLGVFLYAPILIIFLFVLFWIPKYYGTIVYRLTDSEMVWRRGVWFKKTGVVPYNRITNVDIEQGPVSRAYGIASIKIQTAGYSAPTARSSEIRIEGMKNFEELREVIIGLVRGRKPVAVETYEEGESDVLKELVRIRKLLERRV